MFRKRNRIFLSLPLAIAICTVTLPRVAAQQPPSGTRQVNIVPLNLYAPLQVTTVLDGNQVAAVPRGPRQTVTIQDADSNWLSNVSFVIENHSKKDIVVVEAEVYVPAWEENPKRPQRVVKFHEGQLPAHALSDANGKPIAEESSMNLDVKPGTSASVPLGQALEKLRRNYPSPPIPLASVDNVSIQIERVFFADGTMWEFNTYLRPDNSSPGAYVRMTPEEFNSTN